MRIALLDTFYDTSHRYWAEGLMKHMNHDFSLFFNKPHNWKWQMVGGVLNFIREINQSEPYDLIVASDMVNLPLLKSSLVAKHQETPILVYFHENQITYPWSPNDIDIKKERDHHYGWINYISALLAEGIVFNSNYHMRSFLNSLPGFINMFPKFESTITLEEVEEKSYVLPIGIDIPETLLTTNNRPTFIWNHRWEYDKNPEAFFKALFQLSAMEIDFGLIVVGRDYKNCPSIFKEAKKVLESNIIHWGWVDSRAEYLKLLNQSNILLITSFQDFFGISIVEAIAHGCYPILPNRLSYPEHISEDMHDQSLYDNSASMMNLLQEVISKKLFLNTMEWEKYIQKYRWQKLLNEYEKIFEALKKPSA